MSAEQFRSMRPEITQSDETAVDVWKFCGGWKPELIPFAAEFYGVDDLYFLTEQLLEIRDACDRFREAEARAAKERAKRGRA